MDTPENEKKSLIECLTDLMSEPDDLSEEELLSALKEEGIDVNRLDQRIQSLVEGESTKQRLAWRERAMEKRNILEKLFTLRKAEPATVNLLEKAKEILRVNYGRNALTYAETYFHKKENVSEEDLVSLIEDLEDLDILESVHHNEDNK